MARDDLIALIGSLLFLAGVTMVFGPGWALMAAGLICIYTGMRLETPPDAERDNEDIIIQ